MKKKQPVQWNDKYVLNDTHLGRSQALRGLKLSSILAQFE